MKSRFVLPLCGLLALLPSCGSAPRPTAATPALQATTVEPEPEPIDDTLHPVDPLPDPGCVWSSAAWKCRPELSALLPIPLGTAGGIGSAVVRTDWHAKLVLSPTPGNGISRLRAEWLAAKLNEKARYGMAPYYLFKIPEVDAFLAKRPSWLWPTLSGAERAKVLGWVQSLEDYNGGLGMVPRCKR